MSQDTQDFVDLANRLADASRPILRSYYRRRLDIDIKSDASPVTQADREAEAAIRQLISTTFPDHGIFGEEFGKEREDAEYVWVLDPLDGTRAFVTGRPTFGTLISLARNGVPLLGLIDMPVLGDRWVGAVGRPTMLNGERVSARACAALREGYLSASTPLMFDTSDKRRKFEAVEATVRSTTFGGDCYQYGMVATGFLDIVIECSLVEYDYLALTPVIEGAGGKITDWHGNGLKMGSGDRVVAVGDARVLDEALAILAN
ncbi:histidinol-phosphatase [Dongia deserti]|uniref:histidinol-phosphatase n=1 Tax=Dongia deserti TaxID=2268030 RepID=UPI002549459A|nr:histidinol-phosphatase [Dongia deserti]